ncbi:flagellar hook-associated protein FlgL [Sporolactobacillus spathodeae]|uniref:Flagellar hook-associated protein 3 FlgL n=1 Tax=Sporolactobacillus spathodeae TaxID=1465502 RepID=A0ABS2Q653_9BACL|nr:flagellar hook-associated protein FlgL [Sporolactobacillus spathodeae]MBM7657259.1 flagellar hook-associated protein 3 FlgL [Sporolactobacillus spathodeae]
MRVTQSMMANSLLQHISDGYSKLADYQNQLSTGKKITKPSDDPVVATMGIAYRTDVSHVEQYQKNVTTAQKWMDSADSALSDVNDVLQRVRELTVEASNGTYTSDQRAAAQAEVNQLTQQLVTIGNTQVGGQYIFSGSDSANPLLTSTSGTVTANTTALSNPDVSLDVNDGIKMSINVPPDAVFTANGSNGLFDDLASLQTTLTTGSSSDISAYLSKIDTHLDAVSSAQADLGAKENRMTMISNRLSDMKTTATKVMSDNEDADYAETIVNLNQQQNVYNASLSVGARVIQQSLVDYLK